VAGYRRIPPAVAALRCYPLLFAALEDNRKASKIDQTAGDTRRTKRCFIAVTPLTAVP
jgi:hypothetical protein